MQFIVAAWTLLQIVVQVSEPLQYALGIPEVLRDIFSILAILNFRMPVAPAQCTNTYPFFYQILLFSIVLFTTVCILASTRVQGCMRKLRGGAIIAFFLIFGPLANQVFGTMSCVHSTEIEDAIVAKLNPAILCREEGHQVAFWLAIFTGIFTLGVFPIVLLFQAIQQSRQFTQTYAPTLRNPLFMLPYSEIGKQIQGRIHKDERFLRDPITSNITSGVYYVSRSAMKIWDAYLLGFLAAIGQFTQKGSALYCAFSLATLFVLLGILVVYRPYREDTRFLYFSRIGMIITAGTIAIVTVLPNAFNTTGISYVITGQIVGCFGILVTAYLGAIVKGARNEERIIEERRVLASQLEEELGRATAFTRPHILRKFLITHQVDDQDTFLACLNPPTRLLMQKATLKSVFHMENPLSDSGLGLVGVGLGSDVGNTGVVAAILRDRSLSASEQGGKVRFAPAKTRSAFHPSKELTWRM